MNNLETNALRIAELMGWKYQYTDRWSRIETYSKNELTKSSVELKRLFSSYNGLMPIVFECNQSSNDITIDIDCNDVVLTQYNSNYKLVCTYGINGEQTFIKTEETFIKAIQLAVIKYLELKNG